MLLINNDFYEIKNKGFTFLDKSLKENGWSLSHNEINWINYTKLGHETSFIDIKILSDKITVSVPIKNSEYQYLTSFTPFNISNADFYIAKII
jgi:hypothetical protein